MKRRLRLWLAIKILGGHIGLDDLITETTANISRIPSQCGPKATTRALEFEMRLSLTRAYIEGTERSGSFAPPKVTDEE